MSFFPICRYCANSFSYGNQKKKKKKLEKKSISRVFLDDSQERSNERKIFPMLSRKGIILIN